MQVLTNEKRFIFAFVLLILLSTYNLQNHYSISSKFYIKKIIVENNFILKEEDIIQNLLFLYKTNLFFLGEKIEAQDKQNGFC